jgi:hypothetical protein
MLTVNWQYHARTIRVVDGDGFEALIDHGGGVYTRQEIRLLDVDAAELRGVERPLGLIHQLWAEGWLVDTYGVELHKRGSRPEQWPLLIYSKERDKYKRWLSIVYKRVSVQCMNIDLLEYLGAQRRKDAGGQP